VNNLQEKRQDAKIGPDEIHLWFAFPDEIREIALLEKYRCLLSPDETERQQRFCFEKHRHQFLVAHALVRTMLSRFSGTAPEKFRFNKNRYGRPEIADAENTPPVRFNLTHTDGLIACAVVLKHDIGVDVEDMERKTITPGLAERFFSGREVQDLNRLSEPGKRDRFFDYWTLKESYIKARGMGLSIPLDQFSFYLKENEPVHISFDPRLDDDPNCWQFWLMRPTGRHKAALSVCSGSDTVNRLISKRVVPLWENHDFDCNLIRCSQQ
jgi:4'-phosphopantetheinyl transferase